MKGYFQTRTMGDKLEIKSGTLALMILTTLDVLGRLHGYGIARRTIELKNSLTRQIVEDRTEFDVRPPDVESGQTLADAMRTHNKVFSDLFVNMVAPGEAGGILDTILMRLATFLEKADPSSARSRAP